MKHLLNNLSEQEKSSILSQYKGEIEIATKNFKNLLEHKSGSVKPLISEQDNTEVIKQKLNEFIGELKKIPYYQKDGTFGFSSDGKSVYIDSEPQRKLVKFNYVLLL